ncbi:hypothetical protein KJZ63_04815 [Patescibacteria group bacterium]|nr:hypothetical protein [Patescibacteria group bacterium]
MSLFNQINEIKNQIKKRIDKLIEKIALHFIYFVGVGLTAIVAKIVGNKFLIKEHTQTSWKKYKISKNINKMF